MNISYIASSGRIYPLTAASIKIKEAKFHAWEFKPEGTELLNGFRISQMRKQAATYQIKLIVRGNPVARAATLDALHDDFENDVRNMQTGRIVWGDWYADGYVVASETVPHDGYTGHWTENTVDFYVPSGYWLKETKHSFTKASRPTTGFLEFPYDFEYDFTPPIASNATWDSGASFASDFKMEIKGYCINPRITINGHVYAINATIPWGNIATIDSRNKTVIRTGTWSTLNLFDARGKEQSVFEKIPMGVLSLSWGAFDFDLTLYDERSEPKWS